MLEIVLRQANVALKSGRHFYRVLLVEFARDSYLRAFLNFERDILSRSTVIHVTCSNETCMSRNEQRRAVSEDWRSGYVPNSIMSKFYSHEDVRGIADELQMRVETINTDDVGISDLKSTLTAKLFNLLG